MNTVLQQLILLDPELGSPEQYWKQALESSAPWTGSAGQLVAVIILLYLQSKDLSAQGLQPGAAGGGCILRIAINGWLCISCPQVCFMLFFQLSYESPAFEIRELGYEGDLFYMTDRLLYALAFTVYVLISDSVCECSVERIFKVSK